MGGNSRLARRPIRTAIAIAVLIAVGACGTHDDPAPRDAGPADTGSAAPRTSAGTPYALPPVNAPFDYQIGGAYPLPKGVRVVSRDRSAQPAAGRYTICYVNAFQVQPGEVTWWQRNHDDLLLRGADGKYVVDSDWNEILLDLSTPAKRSAVAAVVNTWIDGCAEDGFQAVEPDNIDSYDRSDGLLSLDDAVAYLRLIVPHAHDAGLAIGQKNTSDLGQRGKQAGLDFAVVEECGRYDECDAYTDVYGDHVLDIEYTASAYRKACAQVGARLSVVRRDLDVTAPGSPTYVYEAC